MLFPAGLVQLGAGLRRRTVLCVGLVILPLAAHGGTITVNSSADSGGTCPGADCTLRQAIVTAGAGDTIDFAAGLTTIDLTSAELSINKNLTISGPGPKFLTVRRSSANFTPNFRIFNIASGTATISGLTISNGSVFGGSDGGGILNQGILTLATCVISGNTVGTSSTNSGRGGGISNTGTLSMTNSTISGNSCSYGGGAILNNGGTATLANCTVSANSSKFVPGGGATNIGGTVTLTNCTVATNLIGGGVSNDSGIMNARNSIIAKNMGSGARDVSGTLTSLGYNLIEIIDGGTMTPAQSTDQVGTGGAPIDPMLGPLQDNGGPTMTHALLSGSPATDKGNSSGSNTDQRSFTRPVDDPSIPNAASGDGSDIGAFEVQPAAGPATLTVNSSADSGGTCPGADCTLRQAILTAASGDTINFNTNLATIDLTTAELLIDKTLTISGPGPASLTVRRANPNDGSATFRVFHVAAGDFNVIISGVTIADGLQTGIGVPGSGAGMLIEAGATVALNTAAISGNHAGQNGGGICNLGALTIANSTISENAAGPTQSVGAGVYNAGTLTMTNSTISGNGPYGGGIYNNGGSVTITSATISANAANKNGSGGVANTGAGTLTVKNSIIAENTGALFTNSSPDVSGVITSQGYNLIGVGDGATITPAQTTDQIGTVGSPIDPLLGPLQDNGGPTFTMALLSGSTARDKGVSSGLNTDQRGETRPVDNPAIPNASGGDGADIGAFELQAGLAARSLNLSTRSRVQTGDNVLIGGFIITGNLPKQVVLRGLGPSLAAAGVPADTVLNDPVLELHGASGALITSNDNWKESPQRAQIEGSAFQPADDREAVIVTTLPPASYTVVVKGVANTTGVALAEIYDANQNSDSTLANLSSRAFVETGDNVVIGGFTLGGNDGSSQIIVRGLGPSLAGFGITGALANPTLELRDANGTLLLFNDDWQDSAGQPSQIMAAGLQPSNGMEAALAASLPAGAFTAILAGKDGATGVGLIEIYNLQ